MLTTEIRYGVKLVYVNKGNYYNIQQILPKTFFIIKTGFYLRHCLHERS